MSVECVKTYKLCVSCKKKIDESEEKFVECSSCNTHMKMNVCDIGMYAKFILFTTEMKKLPLTMFQNEINHLVSGADKMSEKTITEKLLDLEEIKVTKSNTNI